jgi:hypothetical protein
MTSEQLAEQLRQDLDSNRQGRLSARQLDEWQRGVAYRSKGLFGRLLHSNDAVARDVRAGRVAAIDGGIHKRRLAQGPQGEATMVGGPRMATYQIHIQPVAGDPEVFRASAQLWDAAPGVGLVRLYYLPESHDVVNVELLPTTSTAAPTPTDAVTGAMQAIQAWRQHDWLAAGQAASVLQGAYDHTFPDRAATTSASSSSLAEDIVGRWASSMIAVTFESDGTMSARIDPLPEQVGRWEVLPDGQLHADLPGLSGDAQAVVDADTLTISIGAQTWRLNRVP